MFRGVHLLDKLIDFMRANSRLFIKGVATKKSKSKGNTWMKHVRKIKKRNTNRDQQTKEKKRTARTTYTLTLK